MSKVISAILGQPEKSVKSAVDKLEDKNGYPSHDVRHLADNIQRTRTKLSELGLDPDDTTGQELYHALLVKFQQDSRQFDAQNGVESNSFETNAAKAVQLVAANFELPQRWVLKNSAAKSLLRKYPPKRLMKQLNYRSLESLLKRENLNEVYLALNFIESSAWQKEFSKLVSKQDSTAFELRSLQITYLAESKWGQLANSQGVAYSDDIGTLGLLETENSDKIPLLSQVVLLVDSLGNFQQLNLSKEIARLSPALAWWSDMDGLIASLSSEHISMNIKDVSLCDTQQYSYDDRLLSGSRSSFWQQLISRYDNQLEIEEDLLSGLKDQIISLRPRTNQPAFEYAENFSDG